MEEYKDDLLHRQYVLRKKNYLLNCRSSYLQLTCLRPIRNNFRNTLVYNDSNHDQNDFSNTLQSVRLLLWYNLFDNDTKHYLGKRQFQKETLRNCLYYITTI